MSINPRFPFSHLSPRRLLMAVALAITCLCGVTAHASAATYGSSETVLNYCSNASGLGPYHYGNYRGLGYIAWDSNGNGTTDHLALDTNGDHHVDIVIADTNEDGTPDWVGLCNGRAQLWYSWAMIQNRLQQGDPTGAPTNTSTNTITVSGVPTGLATALNNPYNDASNEVWSELGPGMSNLILSGDPSTVPVEQDPGY